jgi:monoamine oxidase
MTAGVVISCLPHGVLASGAVRFDPALPAAKAQAIVRIRTGPVTKLLLRFSERFWPPADGAAGLRHGPGHLVLAGLLPNRRARSPDRLRDRPVRPGAIGGRA